MLIGKYQEFFLRLTSYIDPKRVFQDRLSTYAYGTDASFYRLIPKMVVKVKDEKEISFLLEVASHLRVPVTFRAAGTSLSGQSVSDSVLVIATEYWKGYSIIDEGHKIKMQPGLIGSRANILLAPYQRRIGPDPASINSAMIGGIAANNASGMCCGTTDNSYQTVDGMRIVFADGFILDTRDETSRKIFIDTHMHILSRIEDLRDRVMANTSLAARIRKKFKIKNTTGYSLNALVDYKDPFDIIEHLMIGSEGTLGFISEVTYRTVEQMPFKASSLIIFPDIVTAGRAVVRLQREAVSTAELIDRAGLRVAASEPGIPEWINRLSDEATALLVETQAVTHINLEDQIRHIKLALAVFTVERPVYFTENPEEYLVYWKIRKGLFPAIGAVRKTGSTVIIEDVAFPVDRLSDAIIDLQALLQKYQYNEAVIFGHALNGNLHFVFTQDFRQPEEVSRYDKFMRAVAEMVVSKYDGSLKAEHGTGRNVAPFVEQEWGTEAYDLMKQIKYIFDPDDILNPGVILNDDKDAHIRNLKHLPETNEIIDRCTECGFCESSCVSTDMTLTPRQRIAVFREINRLKKVGEDPRIIAFYEKQYQYLGNDTCATDGLCAVACPVKIDTGQLIKSFRENQIDKEAETFPGWVAGHMETVTSMARKTLNFVGGVHTFVRTPVMKGISTSLRKLSGNRIPKWLPSMPHGAKKITPSVVSNDAVDKVVYFPSCINRTMGRSSDYSRKEKQLSDKVRTLLKKAGFEVILPKNMNALCCGMAFLSKGYHDIGMKKSKELEEALLKISNNGQIPILCDMSPCLYTMKENMTPQLKLYEPVGFIYDYLVSRFDFTPLDETITVFPVCSTKKMGLEQKLADLARMCAREVVIPDTNCCGFAGDRGFTFPELNRHGLRELKEQIPEDVKHGYSTSRTCEIGLTASSGISYKSIVYLVDKVTTLKPKTTKSE